MHWFWIIAAIEVVSFVTLGIAMHNAPLMEEV